MFFLLRTHFIFLTRCKRSCGPWTQLIPCRRNVNCSCSAYWHRTLRLRATYGGQQTPGIPVSRIAHPISHFSSFPPPPPPPPSSPLPCGWSCHRCCYLVSLAARRARGKNKAETDFPIPFSVSPVAPCVPACIKTGLCYQQDAPLDPSQV